MLVFSAVVASVDPGHLGLVRYWGLDQGGLYGVIRLLSLFGPRDHLRSMSSKTKQDLAIAEALLPIVELCGASTTYIYKVL